MRTAEPDSLAELFARALQLEAQGRDAEAQAAYINVISQDGAHFDALIALGNLLNRTGYRNAGRLSYLEAAKARQSPIAYVNLGNTYLDTDELELARKHFERALELEPAQPEAHQGMSYVFARLGDERSARRHRDLGFRDRAVAAFPFRGQARPIRAVLLVSAAGGNIGTTDLLDDRMFATTRIFAEYFDRSAPLPEHDIVFNAIGDAERCIDGLVSASALLAATDAPVVNPPARVRETSRIAVCERLRNIPGLLTAAARPVSRAQAGEGARFPLLLRAPGFHTGHHFVRIDRADQIARAVEALPDGDLIAMNYLDGRGSDGMYRKYRVMLIDGRLYPLHLAIGPDWKVHYFTADMAHNTAHQEEERGFLGDMEGTLGSGAIAVLEEIQRRLGLDYAGVDFGLDADGNVLLFEANATMTVPSREVNVQLAYRVPYHERVINAVRLMLQRKAKSAGN